MNLPNRLTMLRIFMVPLAAAVYLIVPDSAIRNWSVLVIFALASLTDYFDGMIARRDHLITTFGKFADPIADKLLVNTLLILLVWNHTAGPVPVLLMTARDLAVDGLRFAAAGKGAVVSAGWWGKVKTVLQMSAIILLLAWPGTIARIVLWLACLASLYSGWLYFQQLKGYVLESM
jgi:CDP-diacylglycerol--glycerol-3-phosphate 3-phosphatidyltransferase